MRWACPSPSKTSPKPVVVPEDSKMWVTVLKVLAFVAVGVCIGFLGGANSRRALANRMMPGSSNYESRRSGFRTKLRVTVTLPESQRFRENRPPQFAICAAAKDQNDDAVEWLEYHKSIGVGKVYWMDNNSTAPALDTIINYVQSGFVEYHVMNGPFVHPSNRPQLYIYDECLRRFKYLNTWMAFLDLDEFLVLKSGWTNILDFMKPYQRFGGLNVHWRMFGTSGHIQRPPGGTLASFTKCNQEGNAQNTQIKSIVNTEYVVSVGEDPHHFHYKPGYFSVNQNFERIDGGISHFPVRSDKIALNHYATKSKEEFSAKQRRGSAMRNVKPDKFLTNLDIDTIYNCTDLVPIGKKLVASQTS